MKTPKSFLLLAVVVFLSGCAAFQVGTDVEAGRKAFLIGNNEAALGYFQRAAELDPNYVYGVALTQNIWSYVGRSEYSVGRFPQARNTLEKSLSIDRNEDVARIYLGLTLARSGDRQQGLKEIQGGMRGLYDRLEYITQAYRFSYGQYWDTRGEIRSAIQGNLAMIDGKDLDWQKLISDSEWVGKRVEEEIDLARRDEREDRFRDSSGRNQP
jgi:tetratricopeptide (TPR) repeat protein